MARFNAVRAGAIALVVLGVLHLFTAWIHPIIGLVVAGWFFAAAYGTRRGQPWAALGGASMLAMPTLAVLLHGEAPAAVLAAAAAVAVVGSALPVWAAIKLFGRDRVRPPAAPWIAAMVLLAIFLAAFRPYVHPTGSMEDTLLAGDSVLVETVSRTPRTGDLIAFHYPVDPKQIFVKRVVGMPGDRIRIRDKHLFRNGAPVAEPYARFKTEYTDGYRDQFPAEPASYVPAAGLDMLAHARQGDEIVVPPGKYFVLGDNRDNSLDSRYWGFVSAGEIIGKLVLVYGSYDAGPDIAHPQPHTVLTLRWNRLLRPL